MKPAVLSSAEILLKPLADVQYGAFLNFYFNLKFKFFGAILLKHGIDDQYLVPKKSCYFSV